MRLSDAFSCALINSYDLLINTNEIIEMDFVEYSFGYETYSCNGLSGVNVLEDEIIFGCLDQEANNYNPNANTNDNSCEYLGCIDTEACNYDSTANTDDGSCIYPIEIFGEIWNDVLTLNSSSISLL